MLHQVTIEIRGPQGTGKPVLARVIAKALQDAGVAVIELPPEDEVAGRRAPSHEAALKYVVDHVEVTLAVKETPRT